MYVKMFFLIVVLAFFPVLGTYAGLDLSFSDTTPPAPLMNDVVPVDGDITIDVMANAPVGTVAAVEFDVIWTPEANVDYLEPVTGIGTFLTDVIVLGTDSDTPGVQKISITTTSGANAVSFGVLVTLRFAKRTDESPVRFDFNNVSALDLLLQPVTPVAWTPSSDITLPVVFSSLSAEANEVGVTLRWHTAHELENAGFNVLRSASAGGDYVRLNQRLIEGQGTSAVPHDYQYVDDAVTAGNIYYYKIEAVDLSGDKSLSKMIVLEVSEDALNPPKLSELGQNYPNPGNPDTWIPYILSSDGDARIEIYNMAGQLIRTLELGHKTPGRYISKNRAAHWDGKTSSGAEVPSGVFFYAIKAGDFVAVGKLIMLK